MRFHTHIFLVVLLTWTAVVRAAPGADEVTALPGIPSPLPSKHYSGYLTALNKSHLHYYFVYAEDVDPSTSPVVLWMNGGPGCSSMLGWGTELGPYTFKSFKPQRDGPNITKNNYTWARLANVLFIESPPGVGFSWSEAGMPYTATDSGTALNVHAAVVSFFLKFPEFASPQNKFYISGESYAGIYVPTLAQQVMLQQKIQNFAGILVGDGVTDYRYDDFVHGALPFAYGHSIVDADTYNDGLKYCLTSPDPTQCARVENKFYDLVGGYNIYGIYLNCYHQPSHAWKYVPNLRARLQHMAKTHNTDIDTLIDGAPPGPPNDEAPCVDTAVLEEWINKAEVKTALHVEQNLKWSQCFKIDYESDVKSVLDVYRALIAANKSVLVYNGNTDMSVPGTGTEAWIGTMGWSMTSPYHPWTYTKSPSYRGLQVGGTAVGYEGGLLWWVRVNGAGHMVPQTRPQAAYDMFRRFLAGEGF